MKNVLMLLALIMTISCNNATQDYERLPKGKLTWIDIDKAASIENVEGKMYFIDVYTEWCGWCKVMDKQTFTDPKVIEFMSENFHSVKFDAEQKEAITFEGKKYEWSPKGRNGINALATKLLGGAMSYPSYVYLDTNRNIVKVSKGFKKPDAFMADMLSAVGK